MKSRKVFSGAHDASFEGSGFLGSEDRDWSAGGWCGLALFLGLDFRLRRFLEGAAVRYSSTFDRLSSSCSMAECAIGCSIAWCLWALLASGFPSPSQPRSSSGSSKLKVGRGGGTAWRRLLASDWIGFTDSPFKDVVIDRIVAEDSFSPGVKTLGIKTGETEELHEDEIVEEKLCTEQESSSSVVSTSEVSLLEDVSEKSSSESLTESLLTKSVRAEEHWEEQLRSRSHSFSVFIDKSCWIGFRGPASARGHPAKL